MKTIKLWLADIRHLADHELAARSLLTPERRSEAERIKPDQDRLHCIAAGLLLRYVLGVTSDEDLRQNEFGKRELTGAGPCFNLSHGGNCAVLAVYSSDVGVDIEPVGEKLPITIPRRYLKADELAWLEEDPTPERFAWLWTRLESALKADGRGFALEKRDFSVLDNEGPWHLETFLYDDHYISCAAGTSFEVEVNELPVEALLTERKP